jgi:RHS repeat-associated protein
MTAIGSYNSKPHESLSTSALPSNQLSGYGYDAAGNMTSNGTATYFYDAENRLIATAGNSYIYDGDGLRVEKCTEGSTPGTCASGATGTLYWRGLSSDPLTETNLAGTVQNTYVFFGGQRMARRDGAGLIHYYFSDHLGSHGVVENATGTTCEQDIDYYPYGGVENDYCPNVAQNYKFTGKERDTESGLDMFGARYYGSSLGRFMTPDWAAKPTAVPYAHYGNPQSLNLYSYVQNNPTTVGDPDGHCPSDNPNCNNVKVETQNTDAKIVKNATIEGEPGKRTGVEASATYKITENGKALANTTVQESNESKTTIDGKTLNIPSNHGPGATDDHGNVKDDLSLTAPAQPGVHDNNLVQGMSTSSFVSTDKQVMTFTTPEGATCSATSERVVTNVGTDGKPSGNYTVTAPTPVVKTVQPPNQ